MKLKYGVQVFAPVVLVGAGVLAGLQIKRPVDLPSATAPVAQAASAPISGPVDANIFVNLSKKVVPSVVNISTMSRVRSPYQRGGPEDLFRRFFEDFFRQHGGGGRGTLPPDEEGEEGEGRPSPPTDPKGAPRAMSLGTGFIIESSGLILTNNHVVAGADEIKLHFTEEADEKPTDGEVVGRDPELDLALIRVKSKRQMIPLPLGDSDSLEVGEYVVAVGNPFGQGHSVTHGIISAKERKAPEFIFGNYLQTDAPINPGNSGGPLVNLKGEVIGINNAIDQRAQGIGFAIPINLVKKVLPQLKSKGTVTRGYIGVLVNEMTPEMASKFGVPKDLRAPFVTHVYPGEPADKAGVKPYDVIIEFNGKAIRSPNDLIMEVVAVPVNENAKLKVLRDGKEREFSIKVAQRPGANATEKKEKESKKEKKKPARVDVGMELENLTPALAEELGIKRGSGGIIVSAIDFGGPADQAGVLRGDVIVEIGEKSSEMKPVQTVDEFFKQIKGKKSYLLRVRRADAQDREVFAVVVLDLKEK